MICEKFQMAALQKPILMTAVGFGVSGLLSGAWLAVNSDPSCFASLIGGSVMLRTGINGLRKRHMHIDGDAANKIPNA